MDEGFQIGGAETMSGAIVVMGVSGCGKSTLAAALAGTLGWRFIEGDSLHPPANIAKMAAGHPLDDRDRRPFLEAVARMIAEHRVEGVVASCSALKRSYRDLIRSGSAGPVRFVLPVLDREQLLARLSQRRGHFMPESLLDSQLATLELPAQDENVIQIDGRLPSHSQVDAVLEAMGARTVSPTVG